MRPEEVERLEHSLVIEAIRTRWGFDLGRYGQASLKRRFAHAAEVFGVDHVSALLHQILAEEAFYARFLATVTVPVTEFFRDPPFFSYLREEVVPILATYARPTIWHAGCATGQEAYSLAILLEEAGLLRRCQIYATDINREALAAAKAGFYSEETLESGENAYRSAGGTRAFQSYYEKSETREKSRGGVMRRFLEERIKWSVHDLSRDRAFTEAHLILCRNTLIYFGRELQDRAIDLFHRSLAPRGILALGSKESLDLSEHRSAFTALQPSLRIYRANAARAEVAEVHA